ncbi:MAG: hypothetical protein J1F60_01435, partial [Oscillospiraceae bacterium]|nr:hypothetical protein [Oscillospiraceae bacterium]
MPLSVEDSGCDIIPVVSEKNIVTGAVVCTSEALYSDKLDCIAKLEYLVEKGLSLEYWFLARNYKKIAFWGLDKLSAVFSNAISNYSGIQVLGIYEDTTFRSMHIREVDQLNCETDVYMVDSIEGVCKLGVDLIIITDWTMRHLENFPPLKDFHTDVIYAPSILIDKHANRVIDEYITRYVNAELYDRLKAKYRA